MKTTTETTEKPTLESLGLKCRIESRGIRRMSDDDKLPMLAWSCEFSNARAKSETFDYFTGSGCGPKPTAKMQGDALASFIGIPHKHDVDCRAALTAATKANWKPDPIEILWAICRDGDALESTFEDWAANFGYDTDSRKAEKVYRACQDNALRLRRILSAEQMREIAQLDI